MKIKLGTPKTEKKNIDGWQLVKEPFKNQHTYLIVAIIIGIALSEVLRAFYDDFSFFSKLYLIILILPIHELFHAIIFPKSRNSIIWIDFKRFLFCVTNDSIISKIRMILIILTPLIFLTIIPFTLSFYVHNDFLKYIAVYNVLGTGGDVISLVTLLKDKHKYYKMDGNDLHGAQTKPLAIYQSN